MAENRSFSGDNIPTKKDDYHGSARYVRTSPDVESKGVKSVNIEMTFEEALRLSVAVQSCLIQLNRYHRKTIAGREMGLVLSVKNGSVTVIEQRVRPLDD